MRAYVEEESERKDAFLMQLITTPSSISPFGGRAIFLTDPTLSGHGTVVFSERTQWAVGATCPVPSDARPFYGKITLEND